MPRLATVLLSAVLVVCRGLNEGDSDSYRTINARESRVASAIRFESDIPVASQHFRDRRAADSPEEARIVDDHTYYTVKYNSVAPTDYPWIELSHRRGAHNASLPSILSHSYRSAQVVNLDFRFPYYGHVLESVVITTGGFLYMNPDFIHQSLALTQYIAPLMANFDFQLTSHSFLYYANIQSKGKKMFIVQWENVTIQDHPDVGGYAFQCALVEDGTIVFSYRNIPYKVSKLSSANHPVTVGLSDAFYVDTLLSTGFILRTIYEYHQINLTDYGSYSIVNDVVIVFSPVKNCISAATCSQCVNVPNFSCKWCSALERCSDGIDRHRQEWENRCSEKSTDTCTTKTTTQLPSSTIGGTEAAQRGSSSGLSPGIYVAIALVILLVAIGVAWFVYAYTHPNSKSGLWLIEHGRFWKRSSSDKYSVNEPTAI
ncbi:plexin domain-containing protein 2-like [Oscarella lobularis]|uniref:plexin domain-containing protein 2-like n=1 Tax=Oscarella lobularis TaxID=121494 RepID=UPI0033137F53